MTEQLTDEEWIKQTYRDELRREPDEIGLDYWIADIKDRGQTRDQVLSNIRLSPEYEALQNQISSDS